MQGAPLHHCIVPVDNTVKNLPQQTEDSDNECFVPLTVSGQSGPHFAKYEGFGLHISAIVGHFRTTHSNRIGQRGAN